MHVNDGHTGTTVTPAVAAFFTGYTAYTAYTGFTDGEVGEPYCCCLIAEASRRRAHATSLRGR